MNKKISVEGGGMVTSIIPLMPFSAEPWRVGHNSTRSMGQLPTLYIVPSGWPVEETLWSCCLQGDESAFPPWPHQDPFIAAASRPQELWNLLLAPPRHGIARASLRNSAVPQRFVAFPSFPSQPPNCKLHIFFHLDSPFVVSLIDRWFSEQWSSGLDTVIEIPVIRSYLCL